MTIIILTYSIWKENSLIVLNLITTTNYLMFQIDIFWDMAPFSFVVGGNTDLWNVAILPQHYTKDESSIDLWNVAILPQHYTEDGSSIDLWNVAILPQHYTEEGSSIDLWNVAILP
jgi:hypothetical protein